MKMTDVKIADKLIGEEEPCFIIAEAGINHNGDITLAKKLIDAAKDAGADAIKFQTHLPEKEMLEDTLTADYVGESLFDLLKRVELSKKDHVELKNYAIDKGILFLSTPFSKESVDMLEEIGVVAYKVGSGEMTNLPLLEYIATKKKPMIISTGMSTFEEIDETVKFVKKINNNLMLLHCTSTYPTRYEDVNLRVIEQLKENFEIPVGLSDHSIGIYTALASVVLGACVIEKHFTISRDLPGPDQKASITPKELEELVKGVRAIEKALGSTKRVTDEELQIQKMARESVVALVEISKGAVITNDMVWVKRPGTGIPAKHMEKVIGRQAQKDIKADTIIKWEDLE
jgi:N-acetylneuraminate synthase